MHVGSWPLYVWHGMFHTSIATDYIYIYRLLLGALTRVVSGFVFRGGAIVIFKGVLLYGFLNEKAVGRGGAGRKSVL